MSEPMENERDGQREYQDWFPWFVPPWLVLALILAIVFACFGWYLALPPAHPGKLFKYVAIGFGFGFCLTVYILVWGAFQGNIQPSSGMIPPVWVSLPVTVAMVVWFGASSVDERSMSIFGGRGGGVVVHIAGTWAVALGVLLVLAVAGVNILLFWVTDKGMDFYIAAGTGTCISLAGLVYCGVSIWHHLGPVNN